MIGAPLSGIPGATGSGYHGFSLTGTTFTPVDYPGAGFTNVSGINDQGTIVGTYFGNGLAMAFY